MRTILWTVVGMTLAFDAAPTSYGQGQQEFPSSAGGVLQTADGIMLAIQSGGGNKRLWNYNGRYGVAGNPGERFSVYLYNPGPGVRKFVVTLDGVNVIDGARGAARGKGYILRPGQAETVRGWRDGAFYREFVFDWKGRDVATLLGQGGNQGTLGVAVWDGYVTSGPLYAESQPPYPSGGAYPLQEGAPSRHGQAPTREAPQRSYGYESEAAQPSPNDLGVGQGGRVHSPIRRVTFQQTRMVAQLSLFYATHNALRQVGAHPVNGGPPQPYQSAYPPSDQRPYAPQAPPVQQPWGGNPFPQDGPSVFRN